MNYFTPSEAGRSPRMRAQRAKLKSRRDNRIIAPDKRSAVRGNTNKMNISLFSSLVLRAARKTKLEKREGGAGWALPGAAAPLRCALPRAVVLPPLQGSGVFETRTSTLNGLHSRTVRKEMGQPTAFRGQCYGLTPILFR